MDFQVLASHHRNLDGLMFSWCPLRGSVFRVRQTLPDVNGKAIAALKRGAISRLVSSEAVKPVQTGCNVISA